MVICKICNEVSSLPYKLNCGHIYCFICLKSVINNGNSSCPQCNIFISDDLTKVKINDLYKYTVDYRKIFWVYSSNFANHWWCYNNDSNIQIENIYNDYKSRLDIKKGLHTIDVNLSNIENNENSNSENDECDDDNYLDNKISKLNNYNILQIDNINNIKDDNLIDFSDIYDTYDNVTNDSSIDLQKSDPEGSPLSLANAIYLRGNLKGSGSAKAQQSPSCFATKLKTDSNNNIKENIPLSYVLNICNCEYKIDFDQMKQINNTNSTKKRNIKRIEIDGKIENIEKYLKNNYNVLGIAGVSY